MGARHRATWRLVGMLAALALSLGAVACKKGKEAQTAVDTKPTRPLSPSGTVSLTGNYSHLGVMGTFQDCTTGERWRVALEGDREALEKAYLDSKVPPASPLLVTVEGGIDLRPSPDGLGQEAMLIVTRLVQTRPGEVCPSAAHETLDD